MFQILQRLIRSVSLNSIGLIAVALSVLQAGAQSCPIAIAEFRNLTTPESNNWEAGTFTQAEFCAPVRAVVDTAGGTHVYGRNTSNHLIEYFQQILGGSWERFDISTQTGVEINGVPNALSLPGTSQVYVFARSINAPFHLLAFLTSIDVGGHTYHLTDVSAASGSSASITSLPAPIEFASNGPVHVYVSAGFNVHDFVGFGSSWQDVNLTSIYDRQGFDPVPYAYGGNSIQPVALASNGDLLSFIEAVSPSGTITGFPFSGDLTLMAGGTQVESLPDPIVANGNNVSIWLVDTRGHLVDYVKPPTVNWSEKDLASVEPGKVGLSASVIYIPSTNNLHVFTNSNIGHLFSYTGDPVSGQVSGFDLTQVTGVSIASDPCAVLNGSEIDVFAEH